MELAFRVREPVEGAVRAEVRAENDVLLSRRLRYVRPSEMVTLRLDASLGDRIGAAGALRVDIVSEDRQMREDREG